MAQGRIKRIVDGSIEAQRDAIGYTHPNLHRRVSDDTEYRTVNVAVYGLNSYRYVEVSSHDEESQTCEIP